MKLNNQILENKLKEKSKLIKELYSSLSNCINKTNKLSYNKYNEINLIDDKRLNTNDLISPVKRIRIEKESENIDDPNILYTKSKVLGKERDALPSHPCEKCKLFYNNCGNIKNKDEIISCCRHKYNYIEKPYPPPSFYSFSIPDTQDIN